MLYSRRNSPNLFCKIDVTAFASIMVVLMSATLFAEMVADPSYHRDGSVYLPTINHPIDMWGSRREGAILVSITRDDKVYFGYEQVTSEQLPEKIKERLRLGAEKQLYIKADARARYGALRPALDAARSSGILRVGILVNQRRRPLP
jgi:biopolymer transport protein ExbD